MSDTWNGVPQNPEREGDHMIEWTDRHGRRWREVWKWTATSKPPIWERPNHLVGPYGYQASHLTTPQYRTYRYLGPCLTPAEIAEREHAAADIRAGEAWDAGMHDAARIAKDMGYNDAAAAILALIDGEAAPDAKG